MFSQIRERSGTIPGVVLFQDSKKKLLTISRGSTMHGDLMDDWVTKNAMIGALQMLFSDPEK